MIVEDLEISLVLQAILTKHDYDLREYSSEHIKRRLIEACHDLRVHYPADLISKILHDKNFFTSFISAFFVSISEFFRDPYVFATLTENVIPYLATFPRPKFWIAGCATGEEAYSLAILLDQHNLLERSTIYATDINIAALQVAHAGIYPLSKLEQAENNYRQLNRQAPISKYYSATRHSDNPSGIITKRIRDAITWSHHDLCCTSTFSEFDFISCRNTLIYFNKKLQDQTLGYISQSLRPRGYLTLGNSETIEHSALAHKFETVSRKSRIYRLI